MRAQLRLGAALLGATLAGGCGQEQTETAPPAQVQGVTGSVSKGPLQGATVDFYTLDAAGNLSGPAGVSSVTTDASGRFGPVTGLPAGVPILVQTSGGSYIDESDPEPNPALRRRITFAAGEQLEAVLSPGQTTLAITPYSMAMYKKAFVQAAGSNFANVYAAVRQQATGAFGFDPISTIPADPITGAGGSQQYAILLGAAALEINRIAATGTPERLPRHADVIAFVNDFADGVLKDPADPADAPSLDDLVRRFRNNNIGVYGGTAAPDVDEAALSQPATVPNSAPVGVPTISGTPTEDLTLNADASGISDADGLGAFSYQWRRNGSAISGATGISYVLVEADVGTTVRVTVSYTDGQGVSEAVTSAAAGPVANVNDAPVGVPTISGTATQNQTLTASTVGISDADGLGTFGYVWKRGGLPISGATGTTYVLVQADVGATITVTVSYTDGHGTLETLTSLPTATVANVNDPPTGTAVITGTATEDQVLGVNTSSIADADGLNAFSFNWFRNGVFVIGATSVYTLGDADVGFTIHVEVSYTDGQGTLETVVSAPTAAVANINDPPTGAVTIDDPTPAEDQLLTAANTLADADGLGAISYAWQQADDAGFTAGVSTVATTPTFTPTDIHVGKFLRVRASYTDGHGTLEQVFSAVSAAVANVNDAPVVNVNNGLVVDEGATAAITTAELSASDVDNAPTGLTYSVSPDPLNGTILVNGVPASSFTQSDIVLGLVDYQHNGSETTSDSFDFQVTDDGSPLMSSPVETFNIVVNPVADGTAPLLPYLTGSGDLKLFDPLGTESFSDPLDAGLPTAGLQMRTLFKADIAAGIASNITTGRVLYIKGGRVWGVDLARGANHDPVLVSSILDACQFNGDAEDLVNPGHSVLRIDTAGDDTTCDSGDEFTTAEAFLVFANAADTEPGVPVGLGQCCGVTGITDANGNLIRVLTTEDDGGGSEFSLNRRDVGPATIGPATLVETLTFGGGGGQVFSNISRGLGSVHVYLRARRLVDPTYALMRFDVATNALTPVYDYGTVGASNFGGSLDEAATLDASSIYFLSADSRSIVSVDHGTGTENPVTTMPDPVTKLRQAGSRLVFETGGIAGGVHSILKSGTGQLTLAFNDATPTLTSLDTTQAGRAYINIQSFPGSPTYTARVIAADGGPPIDLSDAQWAGGSFDTSADFNDDIDASLSAATIYVRHGATTSNASFEVVDPATGAPTGDFLGSIPGVFEGASVFAFGFGSYAQFTALMATEQSDIYLGDSQLASPTPPPAALLLVSSDVGNDRWLFGDGDDGGGGAPAAATLLVSHAAGTPATTGIDKSELGTRRSPKVSADGRYVVFESRASNLVSGQSTTGGTDNVFLYDQVTGLNTVVSHVSGSPATTGNGDSLEPTISANGRYVAFRSTSTNLVSGQSEGNANADVFLFDRLTGLNTLVSRIPGAPASTGDGESLEPVINPDGRYVVFKSVATNLVSGQIPGGGTNHLFLFDQVTGLNTLVSHAAGAPTTTGNGDSREPAISTDGRYVTFASTGTNLVSAQIDTNGVGEDAFLFDRDTGVNTLVSHIPGVPATTANSSSSFPVISADGRYVAFQSNGNDLVSGQIDGANTDMFLFDRVTDVNTLISHTPGAPATTANGQSFQAAISADGGFVSFLSAATNLVSGQADSNGVNDAFLFDRVTGVNLLVSHTPGAPATTGNGAPLFPAINADGRFVSFLSAATNLVSGQTDSNGGLNDVFLFDRVTGPGLITLVSHTDGAPATTGNNLSSGHAISAEGRFVALQSGASDLVSGQTDSNGGLNDVFLFTVTGIAPLDSDSDGLSNIIETTIYFTDPNNPDSDFDQLTDGEEVNVHGTNPNALDTDGDGLSDSEEVNTTSTNSLNPDSDGDDVGDGIEVQLASNPNSANTVWHVDCVSGVNGSVRGLSWGDPLADNGGIDGLEDHVGAGGTPGAPVFVLYQGGASCDRLDFADGPARQFITLVGSVGPGIYMPTDPADTVFDAGGSGSAVAVSNGNEITFHSLDITGGNATAGAGVSVDATPGPTLVTLRRVSVHDNSAFDAGGGAAVTGLAQLKVFDSLFSANSAFAASIGGRGGAIFAGDGHLEVSRSKFLSNQASNAAAPSPNNGGGAIYAEGNNASVLIDNSLFASNSANNGPGGGVNLIDIATMSIQDSQFLSNQSTRPGGGLHIHQNSLPSNPTHVLNNLFVGNATTDLDTPLGTEGGAVEIEHSSGVMRFNANTIAYNQMVNDATTGKGGGVSISPIGGVEFQLHNNIVWFNDNANVGGGLETGDNFFAAPITAPAPTGNNINDSLAQGNAAGMPLDPLFTQGFYLTQPGSASVDAGDGGAVGAGVLITPPFTTNVTGAADSGPVDIGFHYESPGSGGLVAVAPEAPFNCGEHIIQPQFQDSPGSGPGHLVGVKVLSSVLPTTVVNLSSLTTLDPPGPATVIAIDLGDGRYKFNATANQDDDVTFDIYADGFPLPQSVVFTVQGGC